MSSLPRQLEKFCLKSGVSVPSFTEVTWVHLGYPFCWMKSCEGGRGREGGRGASEVTVEGGE